MKQILVLFGRGSPAHAGMALPGQPGPASDPGFPRPRGDGPQVRGATRLSGWVPPPTRGWPGLPGRFGARQEGSPAHAGMAPRSTRGLAGSTRFPRPRGDGPGWPGLPSCTTRVPPPTRGWPLYAVRWRAADGGSPAHAGMALFHEHCAKLLAGFPRPRGDGPVEPAVAAPALEVPPPTRGWPLRPVGPAAAGQGSPAHAGMAPCRKGVHRR